MIMIKNEIKENVIGWLHVLAGNTPSLYVCISSSHWISVARVMQLCIFDINDFYFAHDTNRAIVCIQCCCVGMVRFLSCDWFCIAIILFLWYHLDRRIWTASACFLHRCYYNWVSFVSAPFTRNWLSFLNSWKHMNSNL